MKNEFINKLEENEKILFYGVSNVTKTSKQYGRFLLTFLVLVLFWVLTIIIIKREGLKFNNFIIFLVLILLTACLVYGLVYNIFLKYKKKDREYFVTNKNIAIYDCINGYRIENISDIEHIGILREKDNYGDIVVNFYANSLIDQMKNRMCFEGVENPRRIVSLICNINNQIHIYDDRPTVRGRKI